MAKVVTRVWRGPFTVKRFRRQYKILNAKGETERSGWPDYAYKGAAEEVCRLMNLAGAQCDEVPKK